MADSKPRRETRLSPHERDVKTQINEIIKRILRSGVLVDEDAEYLISVSGNFTRNHEDSTGATPIRSTILILGQTAIVAVNLAAGAWLSHMEIPQIHLGLSLVPAASVVFNAARNGITAYSAYRRRSNMLDCIEAYTAILRLNTQVLTYIRQRNSPQFDRVGLHAAFNAKIPNIAKFMIGGQIDLIEEMRVWMTVVASVVPIVGEDFDHLINYEFGAEIAAVYRSERFDLTLCVDLFEKVAQSFALFASGTLTALGVALHPPSWPDAYGARALLARLLPPMAHDLGRYERFLRRSFDTVRYHFINATDDRILNDRRPFSHVSNARRRNYCASSMMAFDTVIERGRQLFEMLRDPDVSPRNHLRVVEAINEFQKSIIIIYGYNLVLLSNFEVRGLADEPDSPPPAPPERRSSTQIRDPGDVDLIENESEPADFQLGDELFEAEGDASEYSGDAFAEELEFVSPRPQAEELMMAVKEDLRRALHMHDLFMEAQQRFGTATSMESGDAPGPSHEMPHVMHQLEVVMESSETEEEEDLIVVEEEVRLGIIVEEANVHEEEEEEGAWALPPPPPPPLPEFDAFSDNEYYLEGESLHETVRRAARKFGVYEEIFQCEDDDGDDKGEE